MSEKDIKSDFLKITKIIMLLSGTWMIKPKNKLYRSLYQIVSMALDIFTISTILLLFATMPFLVKAPEKLYASTSVTVTYFLGWVKVHALQSKHVTEILFGMSKREEDILVIGSNVQMQKVYKKFSKLNTIICYSFVFLMAMNGSLFLLIYGVNLFNYKEDEWTGDTADVILSKRPLLYYYWLPFDMDKHWICVFIANLITMYGVAMYYFTQELMLMSLMTYFLMEINLLKQVLMDSAEIAKGRAQECNISFQKAYNVVIRNWIVDHVEFISKFESYQNSTATVMLLEFIAVVYELSIIIFGLQQFTDPVLFTFLFFYYSMELLHIFLLCALANDISAQFTDLGDIAFTEIQWISLDKDSKLMLQMIILRCQKPISINIGSFGSVSLNTFINILKASYSYFTFFKTMKL